MISSVEPDIKSTIAKRIISNILGLPVNPVSFALDIKSPVHEKRLKEDFEGLFILSSLCNGMKK